MYISMQIGNAVSAAERCVPCFAPLQELDNNEGVVSMCLAPLSYAGQAPQTYLVVGTAQGLRYLPTDCQGEGAALGV